MSELPESVVFPEPDSVRLARAYAEGVKAGEQENAALRAQLAEAQAAIRFAAKRGGFGFATAEHRAKVEQHRAAIDAAKEKPHD